VSGASDLPPLTSEDATRGFELGPIRPPSEAMSLLVRVIRNCTWNRCTFCPVYKGTKSSQRELEDVLADVDAMAACAEVLREKDWSGAGVVREGGAHADDRGARPVRPGDLPREAYQVELFLRGGAKTVFLQDADPCAVKPEKLAAVVRRVKTRFPSVERVTTYGRARTLARRAPEQLALLRDAGLTRVHLGLESGCDEVLQAVDKGATADELIEAGTKVLGAGMELCFYVMPGLGGRGEAASAAHVAGTARVIRAVAAASTPENPLVVRLRTAAVVPGTPLAERAAAGEFELPDDVEVVRELRGLLDQAGAARFELRSDHSLNLLPELEGSLPADRDRLIGLIDEYLTLPAGEQALFAVGARLGLCRRLADRHDPKRRQALEAQLAGYRQPTPDELLAAARDLRSRFI
jgi:hypothetical protein